MVDESASHCNYSRQWRSIKRVAHPQRRNPSFSASLEAKNKAISTFMSGTSKISIFVIPKTDREAAAFPSEPDDDKIGRDVTTRWHTRHHVSLTANLAGQRVN